MAAATREKTAAALVERAKSGAIALHRLEAFCGGDLLAAVVARRRLIGLKDEDSESLPLGEPAMHKAAHGACCENVVGAVSVPVGVAGPLCVDGSRVYVPLATTEGALVASVSRGAKACAAGGGVRTALWREPAMTRAPLLEAPSAADAVAAARWAASAEGRDALAAAFARTGTRHGRLLDATPLLAGRLLWLRLRAATGDAMGMNVVGAGAQRAVADALQRRFPGLRLVALSGNLCADKKPAAVNALLGRGRSVVAEATVPRAVLRDVLGVHDALSLERLCAQKCWLGSALAGAAPGGLNAHAANVVAALFVATGQDPAQVVVSSNCTTTVHATDEGDAAVSCTMPSVEVGTVGGGTRLPAQRALLGLLGVAGGGDPNPGAHADKLARILCATVLAAELSLLSSLSANTLVASHERLNRGHVLNR